MNLTVKESFLLRQGFGKSNIFFPENSRIKFIKETYSFYHSYYKSHSYKILIHFKTIPIELDLQKKTDRETYEVMKCNLIHKNLSQITWNDLFNEECPLSVT